MRFDREGLEKIGVYDLRNIAREVGVKAPTALRKNELIEEILQIESGKKPPHELSKRGRPSKNSFCSSIKSTISVSDKNAIKKEFIDSILEEIKRKLYEIL